MELKEKCGSVVRGWHEKKKVTVRNWRYLIAIGKFLSSNRALKLRKRVFWCAF